MLTIQQLSVAYGSHIAVDNLSFQVHPGQWLMIVGPNGAGKSSILKAITQEIPYTGTILLQGISLSSLKPVQIAREIGVLSQLQEVGSGFSVEELVWLGRYAHTSGWFFHPRKEDELAVEEALAAAGMENLRQHPLLSLSGGELQRAFLAQALAQTPKLLLLDEPVNHLDLVYQKQIFSVIDRWLETPGRAVVSVVHDLPLARAFGTHALVLDQGKAVAAGPAQEVLTPEILNPVYGMDVTSWFRRLFPPWMT